MRLPPRLRTRYWLLGVGLCVLGVLLARTIAPGFGQRTAELSRTIGHLFAIAGMFVIAYGISRRLRNDTSNHDSD